MGFGSGYNVSKTGRKYPLVQTQEFGSLEEPQLVSFQQPHTRPIVREGRLEEYRKEPNFVQEMVEVPPLRRSMASTIIRAGSSGR